jgi:hypothetical protein
MACARHLRVDALIEHVIDCRRGRSCERDAQRTEQQRIGRREAWRGEKHAGDRREHDQHHYARLAQLVVVAPGGVRMPNGGSFHGGILLYVRH